jgi:ATP-binding cassette, subfamily B, bacterial
MARETRSLHDPTFDLKQTITDNRLLGLWRMLTGYRWFFVGATMSVGLAAVFHTGFYFLLRYYTDNVLGNAGLQYMLPWIALGIIILALFQGLFTFLGGRWAAASAEGATIRLRDYLYDHIQRLSFSYHDRTATGELIQRATSDVDALRLFYAEQAIGFGRIIMLFLVNFVALLFLNQRLALISVIIIPILLVVSVLFFGQISRRYEEFQEQEAKLSTTLQENLTGIRVVRAFARQAYEEKKFDTDNFERFQRGRRLLIMHAIYWPSTDILVGSQMLVGFTVGALMAINGTITVGTYLAYLGLLGWLLWPMRNLGRLIVQMSQGMVSFTRVTDVIKEDREPLYAGTVHPDQPLRGDISFEHVNFEYDGEATVLKDINFHCPAGSSVALVGATGSGKTSLVNLLLRFYDYTGGSIKLDGVELKEYQRYYLRRQIGIVQQEAFLFSRTIKENINYGVDREVSDEEIAAAARAASIHDVVMGFPDGYKTLVGEQGVTLSGGQKQRITLARTLLKDPRLLILDDATSAVDTETEAAIRDALEQLIPGRTTIIIAHRIQTVMNADLILVLDKGSVVQCGRHDELLREEGPYRQIYNLQALIEDELEQDLAQVVVEHGPPTVL